MEYEVYIDSVFFLNFALNFLALSLADRGLKTNKGFRKRVVGSLTGAFVYCVCLILPIPFIWLRICLGSLGAGIGIVLLTFRPSSVEGFKHCLEEMLLFSLILGGIMFCVNRFFPFLGGVFGTLALALASFEVIKRIGDKWRNQKSNLGSATICKAQKKIKVNVLFDTGNGLVEPISQKPVCVVSMKVAAEIWEDLDSLGFRAIPFHSVGCQAGILKGYQVDEIAVEYEGRNLCVNDVYLAVKEGPLGKKGDYDLIMNPGILQK
ncbi:MAG: sigma-E processing peptidase SpoIIGA [Lachnospiraceae bacterium]|nr:sigma-E processing peptidase SpoIIGA [Lachnospiraceae bacterium]